MVPFNFRKGEDDIKLPARFGEPFSEEFAIYYWLF